MKNKNSTDAFDTAELAIRLGVGIIRCGGEVSRAEDSAERVAVALGMESCTVFAIPSFILLTVEDGKGNVVTLSKNITAHETELTRLEGLNHISRELCAGRVNIAEANERIDKLYGEGHNVLMLYLASMAVCAVFTLYFGGGLREAAVSALAASVTVFTKSRAKMWLGNTLISTFVCSLLCGFFGAVSVRLGAAESYDLIAMGDIMLLIPGVKFICAGRDIIAGDALTGILEAIETVLLAVSLTLGFIIPKLLLASF